MNKLDSLLRHVQGVQDNCILLAKRLLEKGKDEHFCLTLISNAMKHDASKFTGIEWLYLDPTCGEEKFEMALRQHVLTNKHHPEFWDGIENMPDVYLAECVMDWKERASEFGTDLRDWIKDKATRKFKFALQSKVYKEIKEYLDLVLEPKFS
jgi:hypothetical protein